MTVIYRYILLVFLTVNFTQGYPQPDRRIYLGDSMYYRFDSASVMVTDSNYLLQFLGFKTWEHRIADSGQVTTLNRLGFLLSAKTQTDYRTAATALFGDTQLCKVDYNANISYTRTGRSAALSVFNLFAGEYRVPQSNPYTNLSGVLLTGNLTGYNTIGQFEYRWDLAGRKAKVYGWFVAGKDSLVLSEPLWQYTNKNKLKKVGWRNGGIVLQKDNIIYGAVDLYGGHTTVYLLKTMSRNLRLMLAASFFVIACYPYYSY